MDNYENGGRDWTGVKYGALFLAGIACGAALGVLYAPKSGAVTRRELKRAANRWGRKAGELYDDASAAIDDLAERGVETISRAKDLVNSAVDAKAQAARSRA